MRDRQHVVGSAPRVESDHAPDRPPPSAPLISNRQLVKLAETSGRLPAERLPAGIRARVGAALGDDLADVRLHRDPASGGVARTLNARAATVGRDIFVGHAESPPGTVGGDRVLLHEAVHAVQQREAPAATGGAVVSHESEQAELSARVVAEALLRGQPARPTGRVASQRVQRVPGFGFGSPYEGSPFGQQLLRTDEDLVDRAVAGDPVLAGQVRDFRGVTIADRLILIERLVPTGRAAARIIERVWRSFAADGAGLVSFGSQCWDLWQRSLAAGANLYDLPALRMYPHYFSYDVNGLAVSHLLGAWNLVKAEEAALGSTSDEPTAQAHAHLAGIQPLAVELALVLRTRRALELTAVGYRANPRERPELDLTMFQISTYNASVPVNFDPKAPPAFPPTGEEQAPLRPWSDVKRDWDILNRRIAQLSAVSPILYAAAAQGTPPTVDSADPFLRWQEAKRLLAGLKGNIVDALVAVMKARISWEELHPIHAELFAGRLGPSGTRWNEPLLGGLARDLLADRESRAFWTDLALTGIEVAAAVLATLTTGGLATVLWATSATLGVASVASDWGLAVDMRTVADAAVSPQTVVVTPEMAATAENQALLSLGLTIAGSLADALGFIKPLSRGADDAAASRGVAPASLGPTPPAALGPDLSGVLGRQWDEVILPEEYGRPYPHHKTGNVVIPRRPGRAGPDSVVPKLEVDEHGLIRLAPKPTAPTPLRADSDRMAAIRERGAVGELSRGIELGKEPVLESVVTTARERVQIQDWLDSGQLSLARVVEWFGPGGVKQFYLNVPGYPRGRFLDQVFIEGGAVVLRESKTYSKFTLTREIVTQIEKDKVLLSRYPDAVVEWRITGDIDQAAWELLDQARSNTGGRFRFTPDDGGRQPAFFEPEQWLH